MLSLLSPVEIYYSFQCLRERWGLTRPIFLDVLMKEDCRSHFELDVEKEYLLAHTDAKIFQSIMRNPELWVPESNNFPSIGVSNYNAPSQLAGIIRRNVPLSLWGGVQIGNLKDIPIRRESILCYVANRLGGVHYDSGRFPGDKAQLNEFRAIARVMDWEEQAFMHAGLVAVGICCAEFVRIPEIQELHRLLNDFHFKRQERLSRGELLGQKKD